MKELFQKLLEAEILSEDVKAELETSFQTTITEAVEEAKVEAGIQVRAELTEQWVTERDALIEAVDTQVGEFLAEEFAELKDDINSFRNLEAEYAERIVEERAVMATQLESDMAELVETINSFLEIRLNTEFEELKEDIAEVKKLEFGRQIFEGVVAEYRKSFVSQDGIESELKEALKRTAKMSAKLEEAETKLDKQIRKTKMVELLDPLVGKQRDVMETILAKLPTEQLEEGYKTFIGRVIKESKEKETTKVLAEGSQTKGEDKKLDLEGTVTKTGNGEKITESIQETADKVLLAEHNLKLKRLAGIIE